MTLKLPMLSPISFIKGIVLAQITCFVNKGSLEHQFFLKNGKLKKTAFSENSLIFALYKNGQNLNVPILTLIFFEKSFSYKNNKML